MPSPRLSPPVKPLLLDNSLIANFCDLDMESIIEPELCGYIFTDTLEDAMEIVNHLNVKYPNDHKIQVSLEMEAPEKEDMCELNEMQMESIIALVEGLSNAVADFECRATENISNINLRLENLISEYHFLIPKADVLQRTGLLYKQRLERKCSDLEKAEAEVDSLGDEVDALFSLLENIYIALDHYSPILKHYPGIIEILKLVERVLSGESTKPV